MASYLMSYREILGEDIPDLQTVNEKVGRNVDPDRCTGLEHQFYIRLQTTTPETFSKTFTKDISRSIIYKNRNTQHTRDIVDESGRERLTVIDICNVMYLYRQKVISK